LDEIRQHIGQRMTWCVCEICSRLNHLFDIEHFTGAEANELRSGYAI